MAKDPSGLETETHNKQRGQGVTGQYLLSGGVRGPGLPARGHRCTASSWGGSTEQPRTWPWQGQTGPSPGRAEVPWTGAPEATWGKLDTAPGPEGLKAVSTGQGSRGLGIVHQGFCTASLSVCTSGCWSHCIPVCTPGCWIHCSLATLAPNLLQHHHTN